MLTFTTDTSNLSCQLQNQNFAICEKATTPELKEPYIMSSKNLSTLFGGNMECMVSDMISDYNTEKKVYYCGKNKYGLRMGLSNLKTAFDNY